MAFTFEQLFAADPSNPSNIAQNASITIFAPGDVTMAPLTITDPDGTALPNPFSVNANGFGPAFMHETLDRVAWIGGGFTGFVTSYEGMKQVAVDAQAAAETAASTAGAEAVADVEARISAGEFKGDKGADGSNVLPTDTAIKQAIDNPASETRGALNATFVRPDVVAHGVGIDVTGVADSTAALQAKIDATPDGGTLFIPNGRYKITAELVISKRLTINGASYAPTINNRNVGGSLDNPQAPYFKGVVIVQTTPGANIIRFQANSLNSTITNLGLLFEGAGVQHTNTGHGIIAEPTIFMTGTTDEHIQGLTRTNWTNVGVYGTDGNHYGYHITNPLHLTLTNVSAWGGGGFRILSDSLTTDPNYGNIVMVNPFVEMWNAGTADGYYFSCRRDRSLNLISLIRPQCNIILAAAASTTQMMYRQTSVGAGVGRVEHVEIFGPDFECWENTTDLKMDFGGASDGAVLSAGTGVIQGKVKDGYKDGINTRRYQKFTTTQTFQVPWNVAYVRARVIGGGGGGGGGSAPTSALTGQVGGAGGAPGEVKDRFFFLEPGSTITLNIGAGGNGGNGGAGGSNGAGGGAGSGSTLVNTSGTTLIRGDGGNGGGGALAESTTPVGGGMGPYSRTTVLMPGVGGPSGSGAIPGPVNVVGGAGGGPSTLTNGGTGGNAAQNDNTVQWKDAGTSGGSGTANGVVGQSAGSTAYGCGGGGGGAGAQGGNGAVGGAGKSGSIELWW